MHIQVEGCCLVVVRDNVGGADQVGVVVGLVVDQAGAVVGLVDLVWMVLSLVGQVIDLTRLIIGLVGQVMDLVDLVVDLLRVMMDISFTWLGWFRWFLTWVG